MYLEREREWGMISHTGQSVTRMAKRFKESGEGEHKVSPGRRGLSAKGEIRKHHHYGYVTGWGTRA